MVDDKFIEGFIHDAEKVSRPGSNKYFLRGHSKDSVDVKTPLATWVGDIWGEEFRDILKSITENDKLIVHWYDLPLGKLILTIDRKIPLYVVHWGGDFYEDPFLHHIHWLFDPATLKYIRRNYVYPKRWSKNPITLLKQLWYVISYKKITHTEFKNKRKTIQRINYILIDPNNTGEIELTKRIYHLDKLHFRPFIYDQNIDLINSIQPDKKKTDKRVRIFLGNSATEANNHVDCFNILKKFQDKDFSLTVPLSYGTPEYLQFVKKKGEKLFGEKFSTIENFLNRREYINKVQEFDIGIMFHNRSQAFGNCVTLLTLGKKLYLKSNNPLYTFFQKLGIKVFDANAIREINFEEFCDPLTAEDIQRNRERVSELFSGNKRLEYLSELLN